MIFVTENSALTKLKLALQQDDMTLMLCEVRPKDISRNAAPTDYIGFVRQNELTDGAPRVCMMFPAAYDATGLVTRVHGAYVTYLNADAFVTYVPAAPEALWAKSYLKQFLYRLKELMQMEVLDPCIFDDFKTYLAPRETPL